MRLGLIVRIGLVAALAAGCTSSASGPAPTPSESVVTATNQPAPSLAPTPSPTLSGNATAALAAYRRYLAASYRAYRAPAKVNLKALRQVSVEPAYGKLADNLVSFNLSGIAFKGTPPVSRVKQVSERESSGAGPSAIIADCPTAGRSWRAYYTKTHEPARVKPNPVPPPFLLTATVALYRGKWTVSRTTTDRTQTCSL